MQPGREVLRRPRPARTATTERSSDPVSASVSTAPSSHQSPRPLLARTRASNAKRSAWLVFTCVSVAFASFLAPAARGSVDRASASNSRWPGTSLSRFGLPGPSTRALATDSLLPPSEFADADPRLDTRTSDSLALVHAGDATSPSAIPAIPGAGTSKRGSTVYGFLLAEGFMAALATPSLLDEGPSIMMLWHAVDMLLVPYALAESNSSAASQWTGFSLSLTMAVVNGFLINSDASKSDVYWINFAGWNAVFGGSILVDAMTRPSYLVPPASTTIISENFTMLRPSPDRWKEEHFVQGQEYVPTFTNRFRKSQQSTTLRSREERSDSAFAEIGDLMRGEQRRLAGDTTLVRSPEIRLGLCDDRDCVSLHYRKRFSATRDLDVSGTLFLLAPGDHTFFRVEWTSFVKAGTGRAELSPEDVAILQSVRNRH